MGIWPSNTAYIDDVEVDVDEGGITLTLNGDFVSECERYLETDDETNLHFKISSIVARGLFKQLESSLYG